MSETNKIEVLIQFNAVSGAYITIHPIENEIYLDKKYFKYKTDFIDPDNEKVVGTYDDYQILHKTDIPMDIPETGLNIMARSKIFKEYDLAQQMAVVLKTIEKILEQTNIISEEFTEMKSYIDEVLRTNQLRKESFANDEAFNYISKQDQYEMDNAILDGGLHEAIGPRQLSDPTISGSSIN